jgi:hypothetical protein
MTGKNDVIAAARMGTRDTFVAVGIFTAIFSERLAREVIPDKLYCVDPYIQYLEFEDSLNDSEKLAQAREVAHVRMAPFGNRVSFIEDFSVNAAKHFADNSVDFIYIDGNHAYKFVTQDLEAWYPKLRQGGLMAGDDAHDVDDSLRNANGDCKIVWLRDEQGKPTSEGLYGVRKAVQDFCHAHSIQVGWLGYQFIFRKSL